jgi:hypothetical protein
MDVSGQILCRASVKTKWLVYLPPATYFVNVMYVMYLKRFSRINEVDDNDVLGCDAVSFCRQLTTFWNHTFPSCRCHKSQSLVRFPFRVQIMDNQLPNL